MAAKSGPLTRDDLRDVWRGATDASYREPIEAAGYGAGLEIPGQAWEVFSRVSNAIDRTTQEMFICPWSGQTNPPAAGAAKATVTLTFTRTRRLQEPLILSAGTFVDEQTTDWADNAGVTVTTGRRYALAHDLVFHPGEMGPLEVVAIAEKPGYGYNNPLPGTIRLIDQPGSGFRNNFAAVATNGPLLPGALSEQTFVYTPNEPDTFVPDHVGQYVVFTGGPNNLAQGRIISFFGPNLAVVPAIGSKVQLDSVMTLEGTVSAGVSFPDDTYVTLDPFLRGRVYNARATGTGSVRVTLHLEAGDVADSVVPGLVLTDAAGNAFTVSTVLYRRHYVVDGSPPIGTTSWRILDWAGDWGLAVTNVLSPEGGRLGWLDELGSERALYRAPGEDDETYRQRIKEIADVVTPNAIRRTLSRVLGEIPWCFREVGGPLLHGFFYDGDASPAHITPGGSINDAYDTDCIVVTSPVIVPAGWLPGDPIVIDDSPGGTVHYLTGYFGRITTAGPPSEWVFVRQRGLLPTTGALRARNLRTNTTLAITTATRPTSAKERRTHVYLEYLDFRGFFLVGVPRFGLGEFGFAYDNHPVDAYDAAPKSNFYDGYPYLNSRVYSKVWQAVEQARAGGVAWDLYLEDEGCV